MYIFIVPHFLSCGRESIRSGCIITIMDSGAEYQIQREARRMTFLMAGTRFGWQTYLQPGVYYIDYDCYTGE